MGVRRAGGPGYERGSADTHAVPPPSPKVVQYLVKPATESEGRCRFVELAGVREYAGAATVFMSHCWGGRWGDLVAAACAGADTNRVVW